MFTRGSSRITIEIHMFLGDISICWGTPARLRRHLRWRSSAWNDIFKDISRSHHYIISSIWSYPGIYIYMMVNKLNDIIVSIFMGYMMGYWWYLWDANWTYLGSLETMGKRMDISSNRFWGLHGAYSHVVFQLWTVHRSSLSAKYGCLPPNGFSPFTTFQGISCTVHNLDHWYYRYMYTHICLSWLYGRHDVG
jgi:hypothetical protein